MGHHLGGDGEVRRIEFFILRLLLGVAEVGFFSGITLYLTYRYPAERPAR
jgi:hypothetical protein